MTIYAEKLTAVKLWRDDEEATVFVEGSWYEYHHWILKAMEAEIVGNPSVLDQLTPRYRQATALRFGVDDGTPRTYRAVAEIMGISQERVRQIVGKVLRPLSGDEYRRLKRDLDPDPDKPIRYIKGYRPPDNPLMTPF